MAISPHEAGKVTQDEFKAVDSAERKLDKILKEHFQDTKEVRVTDPLSALNARCRKEILRRFRASGWAVQEKYDKGSDHALVRNSDAHTFWLFSARQPVNKGFADQINNPAPPPWRETGPINPNWR
jgi:hypothetical protein